MRYPLTRRWSLAAMIFNLALLVLGCPNQPPTETQSPTTPQSNGVSASKQTLPTQPLTLALGTPSSVLQSSVNTFLEGASKTGMGLQNQGIWIQSDTQLLANHGGTNPLSAASLTKAATSLAALQVLGPSYRFMTKVGIVGSVQGGVLTGDLVIEGGKNPFFVWEDAIALAHFLEQQGIRRITGNLVIVGPFFMNFERSPITAGTFLKEGLDATLWPTEAREQFQTLPQGTPKPQIVINGTVVPLQSAPANVTWIAQHQSFPLTDLLKKMNRYSNNPMADTMADGLGGASVVAQKVVAATGVPATEVQLVNGSGLAVENRMSPRAVCAIFLAIDQLLRPQGMTLADVFTVMGSDESVLDQRPLPKGSVLKSGTLDTVSALGGALPTAQGGVVWFALVNNEGNVETFRALQETLLQSIQTTLGTTTVVPPQLRPTQTPTTQASHTQLWSRVQQ